jgi:hypothetical protein
MLTLKQLSGLHYCKDAIAQFETRSFLQAVVFLVFVSLVQRRPPMNPGRIEKVIKASPVKLRVYLHIQLNQPQSSQFAGLPNSLK